jgi:hypothetical protein
MQMMNLAIQSDPEDRSSIWMLLLIVLMYCDDEDED